MAKVVKEVQFNNLKELENVDYVPVLLSYKNQMYEFGVNRAIMRRVNNLNGVALATEAHNISRKFIKQSIMVIYYLRITI